MLKNHAAVASLAALVLALTAAASAGNGAGAKSSDSSINLVVLSSGTSAFSATASSGAHWGDFVTFDVSTSASEPYVTLMCSQNGVNVLSGSAGFFAAYGPGQVFGLSNTSWTGGAADCTADLHYTKSSGRTVSLATTAFHVDA